ncbi:hypothetical protein FB480_103426 [Agrobacterium vitis]|nr:hypothetical protein FB480_103426 [Agrobacterium vitis]
MTETKQPQTKVKSLLAFTKAKYLHILKPIVDEANSHGDELRLWKGALSIEPAEIGGVYLTATCGLTLAVIHDPDGRATEPMTLDIPEAAYDVAKGPEPTFMTFEGGSYTLQAPAWAQPGTAYFYDAGIHISPKMRHPDWAEEDNYFQPALYSRSASFRYHNSGMDYRASAGIQWNWRALLRKALNSPDATGSKSFFNPALTAPFVRIHEHFAALHKSALHMQHTAKQGGVQPTTNAYLAGVSILQIDKCPEFIGLYAHQTACDIPDIPAHFLTHPPAPATSEEANG